MLIKDAAARASKAQQNRDLLWQFLKIHIYSDLATMANHLDHKTKTPVSKIMSRWLRSGLVRKEKIKDDFGVAVLYGITQKGLDGDTTKRAFQPSKVSLRTLEHTLKCQRASSYFLKQPVVEELGLEIVNIESGNLEKYGLKHRPDLLLMSTLVPSVGLICIEVELSLKSKKRYEAIFKDYFNRIETGEINQVYYIFYDGRKANTFKKNMLTPYLEKYKVRELLKDKLIVRVFK